MPVNVVGRVKKFARRRSPTLKPLYKPTPPVPGAVPAAPDYIGIGAMKSGTTWWAALLAAHPSVLPSGEKEVHFFDRFFGMEFTDDDRDEYYALFARPPGTFSGEWTPRYMLDFWTPALLRRAVPDAKLLVMLRDPIERYASGLTHDVKRFRREPARLAQDHFVRGLYHQQLSRTLEHFPREQLLVLQFERCVRDPASELARTHRFLGLDDSVPFPEQADTIRNTTKLAKPKLHPHVVSALRESYRNELARLFDAFPELDPGLWTTVLADGRRATD